MRNEVEIDELLPLIEEVVSSGGTFRFYPRGISMQPMLYQGRDSVVLGKADDISLGDVVFYQRDDGSFVLHRIVGRHGGAYVMCGDHQGNGVEYGIGREQILFKLVGFYKGEEYHTISELKYKMYVAKRVMSIPFYYKNKALFGFLRKVKHIIFK
nr:S24/S26 family peptidase [Clostridia bacterium]